MTADTLPHRPVESEVATQVTEEHKGEVQRRTDARLTAGPTESKKERVKARRIDSRVIRERSKGEEAKSFSLEPR